MNHDAILLALIVVCLLTGWLPTYVIMRRQLIRERTAHKAANDRMFHNAWDLGVTAGQDKERRDALEARLAARRSNFPNNQ